jgi:hypothetical protein
MTAQETMDAALAWIRTNPEAWSRIERAAQGDHLDGVTIRIAWYVQDLRRSGNGTVRNSFTAAFGRILVEWFPEIKPSIRLASSKCNGVTIPPRSAVI